MNDRFDVVVVGAGIVGAACARELAMAGLSVAVVDGAPGSGATSAGMGHLVVIDDSPELLALTTRGRQLWADLADELPPEAEWEPRGTLWVAEAPPELDGVEEKVRGLAEVGVRAEAVSAADLRKLEPCLADGLAGGLLVPDDAVVYQPFAADWLLRVARDHGATVRFGVAARRIGEGEVELHDGTVLQADSVVVAAGEATSALVPSASVPMRGRKGHLVITERYPDFCRRQLVELGYQTKAHGDSSRSVAFNVQPRSTGQLLVGSSRQYDAEDGAVERDVVVEMLERALRFVPGLRDLAVVRAWTGFRAATPDKLPAIGPLPDDPRTVLATGHEGLGITTSLVTAELVGAMVTEARPVIDPAPYRPDRFAETAHA